MGVILSYDAKALLPGHTRPVMGREQIQDQIGTFRDAIEYVLLETLDCMNKGMTISETAEQVKLPEKYLDKEYLGEFYGTVEWSVKSIYCGYVGWFDGNAAGLMPVSDSKYQTVIRELIGDEKLKEKIKAYMNEGQFQIALQLLELADGKESSEYRELKKEALLKRAGQMTSANARHYFIASAKNLG